MATVLAAYGLSGRLRRCDARCHEAQGDVCRCVCGGANHGVGAAQAAANAAALLARRPEQETTDAPGAVQLRLPMS
jgi:hypothetical protein